MYTDTQNIDNIDVVNYELFHVTFITGYLAKAKADMTKNPSKAQVNRPTLLRSLFTLGLLCKQFDFDSDAKPKNEVSFIQESFLKKNETKRDQKFNLTTVDCTSL